MKGQVKVQPLTDFWERFEPGATLQLDGRDVRIEAAAAHGNRLVLKLCGIDTIEAAQSVQFHFLGGTADFQPQLGEDEFLTSSLVGLAVVTVDGEEIGTVVDVLAMPAHDILLVGEIMIPAVKQFVKKVDIEKRQIVVELIEGMRPGE